MDSPPHPYGSYLRLLGHFRDVTHIAKLITGMRGCGKTSLMKTIIRTLIESGVDEKDIVYADLESKDMTEIRDYHQFQDWLRERMPPGRAYVFLDEVQGVDQWERNLNSLMVDYDADIYVAGSHDHLLSSEYSTFIAGRYVQIRMLPMPFCEYHRLNGNGREAWQVFDEYLSLGGTSIIDPSRSFEHNRAILDGVYHSSLVKDLQMHTGIRDMPSFREVAGYVMSNVGRALSYSSISEATGVPIPTVKRYVVAMEEAFLIHRMDRYDLRSGRYLGNRQVFFAADPGIRNVVCGEQGTKDDLGLVRNVVYLELLRRGYRVYGGVYGGRTVDLVAVKDGATEYYRIALSASFPESAKREVSEFLALRDNHPKTVLTMDPISYPLGEGIMMQNVIDWLLSEN